MGLNEKTYIQHEVCSALLSILEETSFQFGDTVILEFLLFCAEIYRSQNNKRQESHLVHYIFTMYSLYVHSMFTICLLYIHYMFTIYSLYIHDIFTIYIHHIFTAYSLYIYISSSLFSLHLYMINLYF